MTRHETTEPVSRQLLSDIVEQVRPLTAHGTVASYIPALAAVPAHHLGLAVWTGGLDGGAAPDQAARRPPIRPPSIGTA